MTEDASQPALDLGGYVPYYLSAIVNAWARGASRLYLKRFGVGVHDWAVLSTLAIEPHINALRVAQIAHTDKAAVSRSVSHLQAKGFIAATTQGADPRRKSLFLTPSGRQLHDELLGIALSRQTILTDGLSDGERAELLRLLRILQQNAARLETADHQAASSGD